MLRGGGQRKWAVGVSLPTLLQIESYYYSLQRALRFAKLTKLTKSFPISFCSFLFIQLSLLFPLLLSASLSFPLLSFPSLCLPLSPFIFSSSFARVILKKSFLLSLFWRPFAVALFCLAIGLLLWLQSSSSSSASNWSRVGEAGEGTGVGENGKMKARQKRPPISNICQLTSGTLPVANCCCNTHSYRDTETHTGTHTLKKSHAATHSYSWHTHTQREWRFFGICLRHKSSGKVHE